MAPTKSNSKIALAYRAMKGIGISESTVKPVLKKLLITYDRNWELIEQENYRALADAIFDAEDAMVSEMKKCSNNIPQQESGVSNNEAVSHAEYETPESQRPLKRFRRGGETSLKKPKNEGDWTGNLGIEKVASSMPASKQQKGKEAVLLTRDLTKGDSSCNGVNRTSLDIVCSPNIFPDSGMMFSSLVVRDPVSSQPLQIKEPKIESGIVTVQEKSSFGSALLVPKDEPCTDWNPQFEVPIQVVPPEGKGWGLKTLQDLPKGAFVCEYVGEILTHEEVHERNNNQKNQSNIYVIVQDADWESRVLKDNETICIDAKYYGNVARFINHRCFDSNLVQIPVEVEFPDHFYYHLALFTTRNVNALEELTLDYGTDFYAPDHATRKCNCLCGSPFCRKILGTRREGG